MSSASVTSAEAAAIRLFVTEDSASDTFWLEMVLKGTRRRYALEVVRRHEEAIGYLGEMGGLGRIAPDVIILNADLPGMSPEDLLESVALARGIPVFVISRAEIPWAVRKRLGADRCFSKPFTNAQLLCCLEAIEQRRLSAMTA
jgi:DNA-binding response OmpR family regulator